MAPVADTPIIEHIFGLLAEHGVDEVHVNVHYLATPSSRPTARNPR
jgi:NDP-sugar pyrophosphorylase family protein